MKATITAADADPNFSTRGRLPHRLPPRRPAAPTAKLPKICERCQVVSRLITGDLRDLPAPGTSALLPVLRAKSSQNSRPPCRAALDGPRDASPAFDPIIWRKPPDSNPNPNPTSTMNTAITSRRPPHDEGYRAPAHFRTSHPDGVVGISERTLESARRRHRPL